MKLVVTGGGTGGHVYPALVVAELLAQRGAQLTYLGSRRGQEGKVCANRGIPFRGFPSAPLYSLTSLAGWKSLVGLLKARSMAREVLAQTKPDVVFSTGGYSAGPVVAAARSLRIPYVIHEANSVPGRSNLLFAKEARAFTTVFKCTDRYAKGIQTTRTGQPIRRELREAAGQASTHDGPPTVLVLGGSQGSDYLNRMVPNAAAQPEMSGVHFIHATGKAHIQAMGSRLSRLGVMSRYDARDYLEAPELVLAYRSASVVVARSGGTLAEIAMYGLPSVLVPLPTAADNHQLHNAEEFVEMGAATLLEQDNTATPEAIARALQSWIEDSDRSALAAQALKLWDIPDATERIAEIVEKAAHAKA